MRWPLRRQILLPFVGLLLLTIGVVSGLNGWLALARESRRLQTQLDDIVHTLAAVSFPLESNVLRQARGLTGAELLVADAAGRFVASSDDALRSVLVSDSKPTTLGQRSLVTIDDRQFLHMAAALDRRVVGGQQFVLHAFYPEATWSQTRWEVVWPPLAVGAIAVVLAMLVTTLGATYFTRPLELLRSHVRQIATGRFSAVPLPDRDDEIRELTLAINQMAGDLSRYEVETRKHERLKTLGTLGGGIAHQVRNAATGCRMALDLHRRDCPVEATNGQADGTLAVAVQQLVQIETHIQRFLALGRPTTDQRTSANFAEIVTHAIQLVRPTASHVGVELKFSSPAEPALVLADATALVQLIVNLLCNAVEATTQHRARNVSELSSANRAALVDARLTLVEDRLCRLAIGDQGAGPSAEMQPRLFEPFATDKPNGTGLGLAVARQIAEDHGGAIRWERRDGWTWFVVELPLVTSGAK
jgi:signal transduction histidine kinase